MRLAFVLVIDLRGLPRNISVTKSLDNGPAGHRRYHVTERDRISAVKLLRELVVYIAYCLLAVTIAGVFAASWRDFVAAFHTAKHDGRK